MDYFEEDETHDIEDGPFIIGDMNDMSPSVGLMIYDESGEPTNIVFGFKQIEKYVKSKEWEKEKNKIRKSL